MAHRNRVRLSPSVIAGAMLLLMLSLWGCGSGDAANQGDANGNSTAVAEESDSDGGSEAASATDATNESEDKSKKRRERTTSVRVSEAFQGNLVVPVVAEGTIRARHSAEIRTEIAGRIVRVAAEEGKFVRKGTLLAKLDDREYAVALEEARAQYFQALSLLAIEDEEVEIPERPEELQEQIAELERLESQGRITREERLAREIQLDVQALKDGHYRLEVVTARSGMAAARAAVERAKLSLERTELRAPFDGAITGLELSPGEQVAVGETLCTLVNSVDIEAQVGVLESDIGKLEVGRPALLTIPALNDTLLVTVDVISPQFDRDSRTCEVLLRLNNADGMVRPGMFARAIIAGETFQDRLLVPKEAILTRNGRPLLFKVEGDRAKWLYLRLGKQNDHLVEIERVLQGGSLEPEDQVIVTDHLTLAHDAKIKVKKVLPVRDPWGP